MNCYAIAVGGSGARAVECLVHLCAAGLGPTDLTVLFVDVDVSNGNVQRAVQLVRTYQTLQSVNRAETVKCLKAQISLTAPQLWSPFGGEVETPRLGDFFQFATLSQTRPELASLLSFCYGPRQLSLDLRGGFRALPALGASVLGAEADPAAEEPWKSVLRRLTALREGDNRVFVCGSIFGGTGAAGLPTIPRIVQRALGSQKARVAVGGALLLPYFSFHAPEGRDEIYARAEDFLVQTHAGLKYYATFLKDLGFNRLYVVGNDQRTMYRTAPYAKEQENPVHFVELLAACAALDFFGDRAPTDPDKVVALVARAKQDEFSWSDVPLAAQTAVGRYARMSFVYLNTLYPHVSEIKSRKRRPLTPWYVSLFQRTGIAEAEETTTLLNSQRELSESCLRWLNQLQLGQGDTGGVKMQLFDSTACPDPGNPASFDTGKYWSLVQEAPCEGRTVEWVWRRLSESRVGQFRGASGLGYFQSAIWSACE